jgi:hypothetical protein
MDVLEDTSTNQDKVQCFYKQSAVGAAELPVTSGDAAADGRRQ